MANEYLQRTPTSTGNRRVWTWSGWVKNHKLSQSGTGQDTYFCADNQSPLFSRTRVLKYVGSGGNDFGFNHYDGTDYQVSSTALQRDFSSWTHYLISVDTTSVTSQDRVKVFINGVLQKNLTTSSFPTQNQQTYINGLTRHGIGVDYNDGSSFVYVKCNFTDVFLVDGQALTPDVFGFYKVGKGYISVGSTQSTDFRPGQWVPKTPRVIKTAINNNGGFGVNGFYLPMNDSNNFGADFHCDPNSIITLNEKLPQPRVGVATTASVGIGYTDALRADPYAANLVLALPFVSGGLSSGFGDYSANIKGSGSAVSLTNAGVSIASTASYYGSAAFFNNATASGTIKLTGDSPAVNFGSGDWTVEGWIFPTQIYNYLIFITTRPDNGGYADAWHIGIDANGSIGIYSNAYDVQTANGVIKANQWTHIAAVRNKSNLSFYINGVSAGINTNYTKTPTRTLFGIGQFPSQNSEAFSGYLQDLRVYKGVAKYTGGFDVPRPYTPVGIATWRQVPDTTANNFCNMNAVNQASGVTLSDGNLTVSTSSVNVGVPGTVGISTGKWYFEVRILNSNGVPSIGIVPPTWDRTYAGSSGGGIAYHTNGIIYSNGSQVQTSLVTCTTNDIIGVVMNLDSSSLMFYKNNSQIGNTITGLTGTYLPGIAGQTSSSISINFGQNPTFSGNTTAGTYADTNGKGIFKYQPPSGFLALCEDNLPTPAIANPGRHFKTVLYTGDGNSGRSIVGVGFTPDLVWVKSRTNTNFNNIADSVRGTGRLLYTNSTVGEEVNTGIINSFNSDGFGVGSDNSANQSSQNFVAWCWRAGAGTTSTNTNGSITSVVSANQDAGFSIVSYTGTGASNATVGHGLGKTPGFAILKCRDTNTTNNNWWVQHKGLTSGYYIALNSTAAQAGPITSGTSYGGLGSFSSSTTFTLTSGTSNSDNVNESGKRFIAYCWAEIEGYSKFGSYTGNGSTDGPFVYCGFKPAWVMIKSSSSTENWNIFDNVRKSVNDGDQRMLSANTSNIEDTVWPIDFLSNGFKNRYTGATNNSGVTYIFAAYAESPFQTANAK